MAHYRTALGLGFAFIALVPISGYAEIPAGYPADYVALVDEAKSEGRVVVHAPIDTAAMTKIIAGFNSVYPDVRVEYTDLNTNVLYNRFISEVAGGAEAADVLWSSALDLQANLVADGYAEPYATPEATNLPDWAIWSEGAYGTSFEPFVFVYNKTMLQDEQLPTGHDDLLETISDNIDAYGGKVVSYNPETSGLAFYAVASDARFSSEFTDIPRALGLAKSRFSTSAGELVDLVASGEVAFAYNVPASYADRSSSPDIGVIYPDDYIVVLSRLAIINAKAKHPAAAKVFLDYLLSKAGQQIVADVGFYSLREDVSSTRSAGALTDAHGDKLKPPAIGTDLLHYLDPTRRLEFFDTWKKALAGR